MKRLMLCFATLLCAASLSAAELSTEPSSGGVPLTEIVASFAKNAGKKAVIDPRAQGTSAFISPDTSHMSYEDFLTLLQVYGFVAVERGDTLLVVPDAMVRTMPVPLVSGLEKLADAEVVTRIIHVRSLPAAQLVPLLRPLIPQFGHLAAVGCTNDLILVDRFGNVKRIEAIIKALETPETYKPEKCSPPSSPPSPREGAGSPRPQVEN